MDGKLRKLYLKMLERAMCETLEKSDAVVWLQGDQYDRGEKVLEIFNAGYAKKIVLTGNNILVGEKTAEGTDNIVLVKMIAWLARYGIPAEKLVIDDNSFDTYEQAVNVLALAQKYTWRKILLVASFYHQPRAYLTFLKVAKEIGWSGKIINQPTRIDWEKKPGGRDKTSKELIGEEIKKINLYKLWI